MQLFPFVANYYLIWFGVDVGQLNLHGWNINFELFQVGGFFNRMGLTLLIFALLMQVAKVNSNKTWLMISIFFIVTITLKVFWNGGFLNSFIFKEFWIILGMNKIILRTIHFIAFLIMFYQWGFFCMKS